MGAEEFNLRHARMPCSACLNPPAHARRQDTQRRQARQLEGFRWEGLDLVYLQSHVRAPHAYVHITHQPRITHENNEASKTETLRQT